MTTIYVVTGSEDGNIEAVLSSKRAAAIAVGYVAHEGEPDKTVDELAREVRENGWAQVCPEGRFRLHAKIERFRDWGQS